MSQGEDGPPGGEEVKVGRDQKGVLVEEEQTQSLGQLLGRRPLGGLGLGRTPQRCQVTDNSVQSSSGLH